MLVCSYGRKILKEISSSEQELISVTSDHCLLDSILIINDSMTACLCSLTLRKESDPSFSLVFFQKRVEPGLTVNFLENTPLTLDKGDSLFLGTGFEDRFIHCHMSYRALNYE